MLVRDYVEGDAAAIVRLYYETIHTVNVADYSPEQVLAWAPAVPDAARWHARMAGRCTLDIEEGGELLGFAELETDGHLDMLYCAKHTVGRGVARCACGESSPKPASPRGHSSSARASGWYSRGPSGAKASRLPTSRWRSVSIRDSQMIPGSCRQT